MKANALLFMIFLMNAEFSHANAKLTLKFHIATATNNESLLGGTLQNTGDELVEKGFINYMVTNVPCVSGDIKTHYFREIPPGNKVSFKIPVPEGIRSYKIISFGGVDSHGLPVEINDETAGVIKNKIDKERVNCSLKK
ncbi:hypothetical protein [Enterobacter kobei]|uniref:hypothetical protein n=1 Tax=Enterobacter kobei TaxID=208224 RepID=UPI0021BEB816|nr:hypothetical protein [Enterobacter kobei]UXJ66659.1 hypothetical protein N5P26_21970 [Enterobacter kobei]